MKTNGYMMTPRNKCLFLVSDSKNKSKSVVDEFIRYRCKVKNLDAEKYLNDEGVREYTKRLITKATYELRNPDGEHPYHCVDFGNGMECIPVTDNSLIFIGGKP